MRNKVAKKLRKAAKEMAVGMPSVDYSYEKHEVMLGYDPIQQRVLSAVTMVATLTNGCTRKVYKGLKQEFKQQ